MLIWKQISLGRDKIEKKTPEDLELNPTLLIQILENANFSIVAKIPGSLSGDAAGWNWTEK